jgi:hypothetical protein
MVAGRVCREFVDVGDARLSAGFINRHQIYRTTGAVRAGLWGDIDAHLFLREGDGCTQKKHYNGNNEEFSHY